MKLPPSPLDEEIIDNPKFNWNKLNLWFSYLSLLNIIIFVVLMSLDYSTGVGVRLFKPIMLIISVIAFIVYYKSFENVL